MARIQGVPTSKAGLMARFAYWYARRCFGRVPEPLAVVSHHPWISRGSGASAVRGGAEFAEIFQDRLRHWQHGGHLLGADDKVPEKLELLPAGCVSKVTKAPGPELLSPGTLQDRAPSVKILISAPISLLQGLRTQPGRLKDGVTGVIEVPTRVQHSVLRPHPLVQRRAGIGREDVEGRRLDALFDGPVHVSRKTPSSSSSIPKTKLPFTMTPKS